MLEQSDLSLTNNDIEAATTFLWCLATQGNFGKYSQFYNAYVTYNKEFTVKTM